MSRMAWVLGAVILFVCEGASGAIVKSGPVAGRPAPRFDVVKCGGAPDDGVQVGHQLCYRTRYAGRPLVIVFAAKVDDKLADFIKKLDEASEEHAAAELTAVVCVYGGSRPQTETLARSLAEKQPTVRVPITVAVQCEKGPLDYGLNPKADVTVLVVADDKIVSNYGGDLHEGSVGKVLADAAKVARGAIAKASAARKPGGKDALKSGPQPNAQIQPYTVDKIGGQPGDGVEPGAQLSYRDRYAGRPLVLVFARVIDERLASLVNELNEAVARDSSKQLRVVLNILGETRDAAHTAAREFAEHNAVDHVAVVVPGEFQNGPNQYQLHRDAETTVLVCIETWVTANFAGPIDERMIKGVMREVAALPAARTTLRNNQERYRKLNRLPEPPFKPGFFYGWYDAVKIGGAADDGVAPGATFNYLKHFDDPERRGPSIIVHARTADEKLAAFVARLDQTVQEQADKKLHAVLNFIGDDLAAVRQLAQAFADQHHPQRVPVVVPIEHENGPELHMLDVKDEVTVIAGDASGAPKLVRAFKPGTLTERAGEKLLEEALKATAGN